MKDLLLVSNGHGEDDIACKIIDVLKLRAPEITLDCWPMVGDGAAYRSRDLAIVGAANRLPSAGFATLSVKLMVRDLRAGWIGTHWRQIKAARALKGGYRMALGVGDIVPMMAAIFARLPFVFVASAKSSYYRLAAFQGFTALEKRLLRKYCQLTFARDSLSADELQTAGVMARYAGNPIMDGLEGLRPFAAVSGGKTIVAMLAGTRADAEDNAMKLLAAAALCASCAPEPQTLCFVFAARTSLEVGAFRKRMENEQSAWMISEPAADDGVVLRLNHAEGMEALMVKGRFADILHAATIAVGMAGTGNEQALGLGLPLIAVPSEGPQGANFVAMKQLLFGDGAITVGSDPQQIAYAIATLLRDPERRAAMARVGRQRMGEPGACKAIAEEVVAALGPRA